MRPVTTNLTSKGILMGTITSGQSQRWLIARKSLSSFRYAVRRICPNIRVRNLVPPPLGLVAYPRVVPSSSSCILPWMASRSSPSKEGQTRCKNSCHRLQRGPSSRLSQPSTFETWTRIISLGYADQSHELETHQGNLFRKISRHDSIVNLNL